MDILDVREKESASGNPLISIIVPVYNVEKYLQKCVYTIINQTYKNIEIILVDDGSTDSSSSICDKLKSVDSRIIVVHKKNGGLSDARNVGIKIAKGEYYSFVDSDDYVTLDMIEYLYSLCVKFNTLMSICSHYIHWTDQRPQRYRLSGKSTNGQLVCPQLVRLAGYGAAVENRSSRIEP